MINFLFALFIGIAYSQEKPVVVASKKFTESVILAEIARVSISHENIEVQHKQELGGTRILWNALLAGDVDAYVDYTGTIYEEILKKNFKDIEALNLDLNKFGVGALAPLGFNNTYAIGMKKSVAEKYSIYNISDLAKHPKIKIGWGEEFRSRADGWLGLKKIYRLPQKFVRGMDHDIAYRALETGDIEVTDLYSTDAEIAYYDLLILSDNLNFFPKYEALFLYRLDKASAQPKFLEALQRLSGNISEAEMIKLNRKAKIDKIPAGQVAVDYLNEKFNWKAEHRAATRNERIIVRTQEHLKLTLISLLVAILFAVPLGILSEKFRSIGRVVLWTVGIIQTIPALALLVVLIKPLNLIGLSGIGDTPALIALFFYSLLPIVRSTHTGFLQIPLNLRETSSVLGLSSTKKLLRIEIPLALPSILSGIKTAAVMNVGFATLGALVGAGGYGQPILTGIRLDDYSLILEGAVPAAVLALLVQQAFDFIENQIVSPGLKV